MLPTIISFYTPNWLYSQHAERLRNECKTLGLDFYIEERPDAGDYLANCRQKPFFILECLKKLNKPVLWIDVDGSIYQKPELLNDTPYEFAAKRKKAHCARVWHVCTMYFTPKAIPFVEAWCSNTGDWSDELALDEICKAGVTLPALELPENYHHIIGDGKIPDDLVIAHRLSDSEQKRHFYKHNKRATR